MPAEDVDVEVRHFLVTMAADIGEQPVTGLHQPLRAGHLAHGAHETADFLVRCLGRKIVPAA